MCVLQVMEVAAALGHVTVMLKGREDIISDGHQWVVSTETGAMRRSGGLGKPASQKPSLESHRLQGRELLLAASTSCLCAS